MILNGKAKEKFFNWLDNQGVNGIDICNYEFENFHTLSTTSQNALIIEFFDGVGIYIDIRIEFNDSFVLKTFDSYAEDDYVGNFSNRQEATIQAIKKANDLYNSRYENV